MKTTYQIIQETLDSLTELFWWNRGLSKLNNKFFKNYENFIKNELISSSKLYLEIILPSKMDNINFIERAKLLGIDDIVIETVLDVFHNTNFKLYLHQKEFIKEMLEDNRKNLILSVPTAMGKTEAFLIPILDYCVKNRYKRGLKALIIYPTKTLEIDQLNRIIKFLDILNNKESLKEKPINIAIWDGDTPYSIITKNYYRNQNIFNNGIPVDTPLRGLTCPKDGCDELLLTTSDGFLQCPKHEEKFTYIRAIRETIEKLPPDILITNPEALDFLLANPKKIDLLGEFNTEYPLKYIVYDEAHVWKGSSGASISLLNKRLSIFYNKSSPKFIFLSATIKNPEELVRKLGNNTQFNSIKYYAEKIQKKEIDKNKINFYKWEYCNFLDLFLVGLNINNSYNFNKIKNFNDYEILIKNLKNLNLFQKKLSSNNPSSLENHVLSDSFKELLYTIKRLIEKKIGQKIDVFLEMDKKAQRKIISEIITYEEFKKIWTRIIYENLDELFYLFDIINALVSKKSEITIINIEEIIEHIKKDSLFINKNKKNDFSIEQYYGIIEFILNLGRISGLFSNRYHIFLKTYDNIYLCPKCKSLTTKKTHCNTSTFELGFCRTCHHPYIRLPKEGQTEIYNKYFQDFHVNKDRQFSNQKEDNLNSHSLTELMKNKKEKIAKNNEEELFDEEEDLILEDFEEELFDEEEGLVLEDSEEESFDEEEGIILEDSEEESLNKEEINEEEKEYTYDQNEDSEFIPLGFPNWSPKNICPNCNSNQPQLQLYTGTLYSTTLINLLLSILARYNNSGKVITFSDSRKTAEQITSELIKYDYNLTTARWIINFLLKNSNWEYSYGKKISNNLSQEIMNFLKETYQENIGRKLKTSMARSELNTLFKQKILLNAYLAKHRHLIFDALITLGEFYKESFNTAELVIGQELLKIFFMQSSGRFGFQKNNINFKSSSTFPGAYLFSKLQERLIKTLRGLDKEVIIKSLPKVLKVLIKTGIIRVITEKELNNLLNEQIEVLRKNFKENDINDKIKNLKLQFTQEVNTIKNVIEFDTIETPLFAKGDYSDINCKIIIPKEVQFCINCYNVYPISDKELSICPKCKSKNIIKRKRLVHDPITNELIYNPLKYNIYDIDHWGQEVHKYYRIHPTEFRNLVVSVHRAGISFELRGAIEQAFRKDLINIVNATPTMELGIDIGKLDTAIQVGFPPTLANYIQRIGRTGRSPSTNSLIFTIIRNQNPIDSYYFEHINSFFSKLSPIYIPNPYKIKEIFFIHIFSAILTYLSRNFDFGHEYLSIYHVNDVFENPRSLAKNVKQRIARLINLIRERRTEIINYLKKIFNEQDLIQIDILERLIFNKNSLLKMRMLELINILQELPPGDTIKKFSENLHEITQILNTISLFCKYRKFEETIPIRYTHRKSEEIYFEEISRVIRERFPGVKNKLGARFLHFGADYIVDSVTASKSLGMFKICSNINAHPLLAVKNTNTDTCPLCSSHLATLNVFKPLKVNAINRTFLFHLYKTYPLISYNVEILKKDNTIQLKEIGKIKTKDQIICTFKQGKFEVVEFTYKYIQSSRYSGSYGKILDSQAEIIEYKSNKEDVDIFENIDEEEEDQYAPIGNKIVTEGLLIQFNLKWISDVLEDDKEELIKNISQFIISFAQALKRSVSILTSNELNDFNVVFQITPKFIEFYIYEKLSNLSGLVEKIILNDLKTKEYHLFKLIKKFAHCPYCGSKAKFCSECLLIERTPPEYIKFDLLNKFILQKLFLYLRL
ncbi:MAG: DEAD/DEAH box helicase [Promethearchaeota archaeon]